MLLRTLWCRLGSQLSVDRKPVFICALTSISQSVHPFKYASQPSGRFSGPWIFSKSCYFYTQQQPQTRPVLTAAGGFIPSTLLTDSCVLSTCISGQKRLYSSSLVKSMLKPSIKPGVVSGKRVPKGPRTKQPSRTNQPSLKEDEVVHQIILYDSCHAFVLPFNLNLCFYVGYDAMYCLCNSRSVSLTNTLP